jgi:glutamate-1-semialdehyde 2,1-aminomutase
MREEDAPARIDAIGAEVQQRWREVAESLGLPLRTAGVPALGSFAVPHLDPTAVKTLVTRLMLASGYLAGTAAYISLAHTDDVLDHYFPCLEGAFRALRYCETTRDVLAQLPDGTAQSGFYRLT